jgi:hypothetical protein
MDFDDYLTTLRGGTYATFGKDALWAGGTTPVRVVRKSPDEELSFGKSSLIVPTAILKVRSLEVASPKKDDLVVFVASGATFKIVSKPKIDDRGGEWTCEAVESK